MSNFQKIEDEFYASKYISKFHSSKYGNPNELWQNIKQNKDLLVWATELTKDKFGQRDLVNGLAISEAILIDYANVDKEVYDKLIKNIYDNKDIARIVLDGYSNGGFSFLLMSLWNPTLKLTEEQKQFAVSEAMNKIGTVKYQQMKDEYAEKLDKHGITDDKTTTIDIDGSINPIGAQTKNLYMYHILNRISDTQAHGRGEFDIRYWILRNPNWTVEEKQKLIMDFWVNNDTYDECLEQWEWDIVNSALEYDPNIMYEFEKCSMYEISYYNLLVLLNNKDVVDSLWEEIQFCKLMHKLRPQQWELESKSDKPRQLVKTNNIFK